MELSKKYDEFLYKKTQSQIFVSTASKMNVIDVKRRKNEDKLLNFYRKNNYKSNYKLELNEEQLRMESDILYNKLMKLFSEAETEFKVLNNITN